MSAVLADQLQIWGFEEDVILFADGSLGFALEATPIDISCLNNESVNGLVIRLGQFFNSLPTGTFIQFVQEIEKGNDSTIQAHKSLSTQANNEIASKLTDSRIDILNAKDSDGLIPRHGLKVVVRRMPTQNLFDKPQLFSKPKQFEPIAEERLKREADYLLQLRNEIITGLLGLGISSRVLEQNEFLQMLYRQWNPSRPVDLGFVDFNDVRSSLLFTDVLMDNEGFALGKFQHRVITLKLLPDQTVAGMAQALRGLPFGSKVFLSTYVPDQQKELENLQLQRRLAFSMARGKTKGVSDIESETKLQDLESLLGDLIAQGEKVFHISFHILLSSENKDELDSQVAQTLTTVRELNNAEAMVESLASFDQFCNFALPNAKTTERVKKVKTSNLADIIPVYGPWRGHDTPRVLLRSRIGSLVAFDPFDSSLTNYNHIVSGGSGSGKSFFTNILLLQMLKENPRVFVVDIGGSYKKLCDNLAGQYVPLGVDIGLSINPFDLKPDEAAPGSDKIKFLVGLIEMMTKEEGETRISRFERAEIEDAIVKVYDKQSKPTLSHLREELLNHSESELRRLGKILSPWCGNSAFGQFVDRPTTLQLDRNVVCFDLKGLETYPDLQAVCLFIITDYIWREVQRDRSEKKFLVFDECWKLLENEAGATFIGEVFRTFRKYFASAIAISQNLDDFAKSKVATAILSNSSLKWLLMQKGADQARLKEVLQLNDNEMELIASLHQERGVYSEAFLMAGDNRSVIAVEPTPLEYWIATTDPRDLAKIQEFECSQPDKSMTDILIELSKKYPNGCAVKEAKR